jgi:hypothetical protein
MNIIKDTFFGGAEKKAAAAQERGLDRSIEEFAKGTEKARSDVMSLYPSAENNLKQGAQGALDVMGQFLPQQANVFQQGNMNAQNQISAGLPQIQNALMGGAVDYSQFQPQQINYDQSIFSQQLPEMQTSQQALNPEPSMNSQQVPFNPGGIPPGATANSFLSGRMGNGRPFNSSGFNMQNMRIR